MNSTPGDQVKKAAKKRIRLVAISIAICFGFLGVIVAAMAGILGAGAGAASAACNSGATAGSVNYKGATVQNLTPQQMNHAAAIVAAGRQMGIPDKGIVVALATAYQESRYLVYANDGTGVLAADQHGIGASMQMPHDAVGRDHGSLGIFQQQWPWWGSMQQLMDPVSSAQLFYKALERVPGWQSMPVTVAAQTVQRSAYPSAYAPWQPLAEQILATVTPSSIDTSTLSGGQGSLSDASASVGAGGGAFTTENGVTTGGTTDCATPSVWSNGNVVFPLPANSGYIDDHNYGELGSHWKKMHTGDDFSVACGTPVYAVTSGTIILKTGPGWTWAGNWLVQVQTAPGSLTTWYAHMQAINVVDGQHVNAGDQIGNVGALGNATGCHLHLEVHPQGGGYDQDQVNPDPWLSANLGNHAASGPSTPGQAAPTSDASSSSLTLMVAAINAGGKSDLQPLARTLTGSSINVVAVQNLSSSGAQWLAAQLAMQVAYADEGKVAVFSKYPIADSSVVSLPGGASLLSVHLLSSSQLVQMYAAAIPGGKATPAQKAALALAVNASCSTLLAANITTPVNTLSAAGTGGGEMLQYDPDSKTTSGPAVASAATGTFTFDPSRSC